MPAGIRHTIAFTLEHDEGSIPGAGYRFGISIEFADRAAYDGYNEHPDHVGFVQERRLVEV